MTAHSSRAPTRPHSVRMAVLGPLLPKDISTLVPTTGLPGSGIPGLGIPGLPIPTP